MSSILSIVRAAMENSSRRCAAALIAAAVFMAAAAPALAADGATVAGTVFVGGVRLQDEVAVVNVRNLCGVCDTAAIRSGVRFENYAVHDELGRRRWQPSDLDSFVSFDPSVRTIFFVHGNQITSGDAKCEGLEVYRRLLHTEPDAQRIRFVIFSWPSAKVPGLLRDFREKAARTGPAGCQLAWLLDQMPAQTPVSLVGFSYGARIITGGLHMLAGGTLGGAGLAERANPGRTAVNAVLLSAAMHAHWLGEGQFHGLAMSQVDQMFLINSCQDRAMRYYHLSATGGRPQALGLRGPTRLNAEQAAKVRQRDISRYTGSGHDLYQYISAPGATAQIWDYLTGAVAAAPLSN
jgi:hypothetical protein